MSEQDIASRLRWLLDEFESNADAVYYERGTGEGDRISNKADKAAAKRVVEHAILLLKRAGLAGAVVPREPEAET